MNSSIKRLLVISNYITDDTFTCFMRNQSGYGYIVRDISCAISKTLSTRIFTYSGMHPSKKLCSLTVLDNRPLKVLSKVHAVDIWDSLRYLFNEKSFSRDSLRVAYSYLVRGYLLSELKLTDIVHIHGATPNLMPLIKLCLNSEKKVIITLHGLNSFSKYTKASQFIRNSEIELLGLFQKYENVYLTVLTPRAKELIVEKFGKDVKKKIKIIPNFLSNAFIEDYKNVMPVKTDKTTILYVGNISKQKNQEAIIKTVLEFYHYWKDDYQFVFIGELTYELNLEGLEKAIKEKVILFTGSVSRAEVHRYYAMASLVVLLSKAEGFGMSIIEGFLHGVPALISSDIEISSMLKDKKFVDMVDDLNNTHEIFTKIHNLLDLNIEYAEVTHYAESFYENIVIRNYISILVNTNEDYDCD